MSDFALIRDQIKARVRLSEIIGRKVAFDRRKSQPSRGEFWACCPFHAEKSPSFHVLDREGYYKCFGCGAGGDIVNFIMETENRSYRETMEMLAELAGLELPKPSPEAVAQAKARASLHEVLEHAAQFFEHALAANEGANARAYLDRRGIPRETQARFRLGFAPGSGHALINHLKAEGIGHDQMREAGLLSSRDEPNDLMRNRLIFPITDGRGRVIAFGGRALEADPQIKYLNSPETILFDKGRSLYNFANARKRVAIGGNAAPASPRPALSAALVVAEGYMDVIALTRAGFERSVAPLGTALTADQLELLWSIDSAPVISFDGDNAGRAAAARALDRALPLLKAGRTLSFAFLPEGQDPDDLMREGGSAAVVRAIEKTEPLAEVLWTLRTQSANLATPDGRAQAEAALREAVATIGDMSVRRHYEAFVRERVGQWLRTKRTPNANGEWRPMSRDRDRAFGARPAPAPRPSQELRAQSRGRTSTAEETLLLSLLTHPALAAEMAEEVGAVPLSDARLEALRGAILGLLANDAALDRAGLQSALAARGQAAVARALLLREGLKCLPCANPAAAPDAARASLKDILDTLGAAQNRGETAAAVEAAMGGELSQEGWDRAKAIHLAGRLTPQKT